jgi:hypothetical protein
MTVTIVIGIAVRNIAVLTVPMNPIREAIVPLEASPGANTRAVRVGLGWR